MNPIDIIALLLYRPHRVTSHTHGVDLHKVSCIVTPLPPHLPLSTTVSIIYPPLCVLGCDRGCQTLVKAPPTSL